MPNVDALCWVYLISEENMYVIFSLSEAEKYLGWKGTTADTATGYMFIRAEWITISLKELHYYVMSQIITFEIAFVLLKYIWTVLSSRGFELRLFVFCVYVHKKKLYRNNRRLLAEHLFSSNFHVINFGRIWFQRALV